MMNYFGNRGPVFSGVGAVGGFSAPAPSVGTASSSGGGTAGQFQSAMASQGQDYIQAQQLEEQSHKMQMMGDAALKALKAVQIS